MQITIKDAVIKQIIADTVEQCLDRKDAKLVKEILADEKVMAQLAKKLGTHFSEYYADLIFDLVGDIRIPALGRAIKAQG
jgi:hypothetical protein